MSFWIVPESFCRRHALLLGGDDVERHDRKNRTVHGHRDRHLVQRDLVEEDLHVLDRIDRDTRLADVADDALVVRVVAAMRGEVERDRQALLPGGEVTPVEGVGLLRGRETCVLADRPRLQRVHRRIRTAQEGRQSGGILEVFEALEIGAGVVRLDRNALGRHPGTTPVVALATRIGVGGAHIRSPSRTRRAAVVDVREVRASHRAVPGRPCHGMSGVREQHVRLLRRRRDEGAVPA